jgi:6-pyruvoyltetrahydropterin/6-carboxytetrahydropterin synthase
MLIRKLFKYEASHQVHEAWSPRCKNSIHGHSFIVEFLFEGKTPDNAHMVMDFGFVKKFFHPFVDSFDHTHILWSDKKYEKVNSFIKDYNERWIELPFNSSAEMQAKMFFVIGWDALLYLKGKKLIHQDVFLSSVKVHETTTGYAEYRTQDVINCLFPKVFARDIKFSSAILAEWPKEFIEMFKTLK